MRGVIKTSSLAVMLCTAVHAHSADIPKTRSCLSLEMVSKLRSWERQPTLLETRESTLSFRHARPRLSQQAQSLSNPEHDLHGIPTQKARP